MNLKSIFLFFVGIGILQVSNAQNLPRPSGGEGGARGDREQRQSSGIPNTLEDNSPKGNAKVSGVVIDSTTSQPVEFAAVALFDSNTNHPLDGATTNEKGEFDLKQIPAGYYKLVISFVGYANKEIRDIKLDRRSNINFGKILLTSDIIQLGEVKVVGLAELIEEKVDRLVYNAEKDVTSKGGDASDIMRKVPMLSVDLEGNVSLRGSSNIRVLINNKPSTIMAATVADALKQIPAEMIKSVEVITSPSAKYDAEGTAGIINIITKKSNIQGGTLNIDTGVGNRGSNLGLRGNYRAGKVGMSLGGFGRFNYNMPGKTENVQQIGDNLITQSINSKNSGGFGRYNFGVDYDVDKNSTISAGVRYGMRNMNNTQEMTTFTQATSSLRDVDVKDMSNTWDLNLDYIKTIKPQHEFAILSQFSRNNGRNDFDAYRYALDGNMKMLEGEEWNRNKSVNQESTVQVDYSAPISTNQTLEVGAKGIFRQVTSDITYGGLNYNPNSLDYDQNVAGGYLSYTLTTANKITVKAGGRYEYTLIDAREKESGALNLPSYGNLVPSLNISKTFNNGKTYKLGYSRRLQRPGIRFLNPNENVANPTNVTKGNPNLDAELTDQIELGTSFFKKNFYLSVSTFARFTDNSIESIRIPSPVEGYENRIMTTYGNIGEKQNYGVNINANLTLFNKWQLNFGVDPYYARITNNSPDPATLLKNSGLVIMGRFRTSVTLGNGWAVEGFGFGRGSEVQLQGSQAGFRVYSLGFKKDFKNKQGSFGFGMENFLQDSFKMKTQLASQNFTQNSTTYLFNRGFRANISYRIGKMNFTDQPRRKRSISNDDVKGSGGDGGGMEQGGGNQGGGSAAPAGGGQRGGAAPQRGGKAPAAAPAGGSSAPQPRPGN